MKLHPFGRRSFKECLSDWCWWLASLWGHYPEPKARLVIWPRNRDPDSKKPRLFYYEEAESAWCPVPPPIEKALEGILMVEQIEPGESVKILFARKDMTDAEFAAIPEG